MKSYEHAGFLLADRRESVMTRQGVREVRFMELDDAAWRQAAHDGGLERKANE